MMRVALSREATTGVSKTRRFFVLGMGRRLQCDALWRTTSGRIRGFVGARAIDAIVIRDGAGRTLNGVWVGGAKHLLDLDLGFTPATNLQQLRRVSIAENEAVQLPVAWLDVDAGALTELPQIYERRGRGAFWYQAPSVGYEGLRRTRAERIYSQLSEFVGG